MSKDGSICFIVVSDEIIKVLSQVLPKMYANFSDLLAAILNFIFYNNFSRARAPHPPRYHYRGAIAKHNRKREKSVKTMLPAAVFA